MSEERWQIHTQEGDYRYVVQDTEDKFSFMCFQDKAAAEGVANLLNDAASERDEYRKALDEIADWDAGWNLDYRQHFLNVQAIAIAALSKPAS